MRGEQRRYERRKRRAGGAEERGGQSESKRAGKDRGQVKRWTFLWDYQS